MISAISAEYRLDEAERVRKCRGTLACDVLDVLVRDALDRVSRERLLTWQEKPLRLCVASDERCCRWESI